MHFDETVANVARGVEGLGVAVIVAGVVAALARSAVGAIRQKGLDESEYRALRRNIGRSILLGLELLVAGDIIRTVTISPTFTSVGVLALIVAVRTFLSFTLEVELTARWPWQRDRPLD